MTRYFIINLRKSLALSWLILSLGNASAAEYRLYFLGGQSNMDGFGLNSELPADLAESPHNVMIFHGNSSKDGAEIDGKGLWTKMKPGHGRGFSSDGIKNSYGEKFGPELSFAHYMSAKYPKDNIAVIKYSKGGTSIDCEAARDFGCWEVNFTKKNGINQYDHYLATLKNAFAVKDIDGDGENDKLVPHGLIWMQGESDALLSRDIALRYQENLTQLIFAFRKSLTIDELPVVIGQISDSMQDEDGLVWNFGDIVRDAQANFVLSDSAAALIQDTDTYGYSDRHHYDSEGFKKLGKSFAREMIALEDK
jgi:hypothetical protein